MESFKKMLSRASFLSVRLLSLVLVLCLGCVIAVAQKQLHINDSDVSFGGMGRSENGRGDSQGDTTSWARVGTKGSLQRLSGNKSQAEIRLEQTIYKAIYKESARFKIDP